jgi:hypothetical protein
MVEKAIVGTSDGLPFIFHDPLKFFGYGSTDLRLDISTEKTKFN